MLDYIYQWMENIAFYLVILVVVVQMVPSTQYKKYIRFFAGLILIFMLTGPILKLFGISEYQDTEYQKELKKIQEATKQMEDILREGDVLGD